LGFAEQNLIKLNFLRTGSTTNMPGMGIETPEGINRLHGHGFLRSSSFFYQGIGIITYAFVLNNFVLKKSQKKRKL
jgi:hypothetical protein